MRFTIKEIENAAKMLKNIEPRLANELNRIVEEASNNKYPSTNKQEIELINKNEYFASILWTRYDIKCTLEENGYEGTDENINAVLNEISISDMEDCENGWNIINAAFYRCKENLSMKEGKVVDDFSR